MKFAQGIVAMNPSATRAIAEKADQLKASGKQVISLASGAPSFAAPEASARYARQALEEGRTFYTPTAGIPELRQEVAGYYRQRFDLEFTSAEVMIGAGAKPLIFETLGTILDPGDEVIVPAPAWVSYVEQIKFFGGRPVVVDSNPETYDIDPDRLRDAVNDRTVAIIINSPNNPTGRVYHRNIIEAICRLALEHQLLIINDEVYERLTYGGGEYRNPLCFVPEVRDNLLTINAVSKTFSMTGWRIGYALGPEPLIKKISALQGHLTSGACSVAQWAALGALRGAEAEVGRMIADFARRRELLLEELRPLPLISLVEPEGAFYVFVDIRRALGKRIGSTEITGDLDFVQALLEKEYVSSVPGTAFLYPGFIRLSFTQGESDLRAGIRRLGNFLRRLE